MNVVYFKTFFKFSYFLLSSICLSTFCKSINRYVFNLVFIKFSVSMRSCRLIFFSVFTDIFVKSFQLFFDRFLPFTGYVHVLNEKRNTIKTSYIELTAELSLSLSQKKFFSSIQILFLNSLAIISIY